MQRQREPLDEDGMHFEDGEVVAMSVKELPLFVWRTFVEGRVALSEGGGAVATLITEQYAVSLTTTGLELTEGKHYWEVELLDRSGRRPQGAMPVSGMPWGAPGGIAG
jgi:hypothetical protein